MDKSRTKVHLRGRADRIGLLPIDSVNVLERSHYLPVFARLGPCDKAALDRFAFGRKPNLFEYRGNVAFMMPVELS